MSTYPTPALVLLDAEVARLSRPRAWARVQASWAGDAALARRTVADLLAALRASGPEADRIASGLTTRAAQGDAAALALVLAALVGVFVAVARRRGGDVDVAVSDQLSLAAEIVRGSPLPAEHVLAVLVSRVQSRHRRLRRRSRCLGGGGDGLCDLVSGDDPARRAIARIELAELGAAVRRHVRAGSFTTGDWCRLVELRVLERSSAELAGAASMTPAAVRKRAQRTAAYLAGSEVRDAA